MDPDDLLSRDERHAVVLQLALEAALIDEKHTNRLHVPSVRVCAGRRALSC